MDLFASILSYKQDEMKSEVLEDAFEVTNGSYSAVA